MLRGTARHCDDCATETIFVPLGDEAPEFGDVWLCTTCDEAVVVTDLLNRAA